MNSWGLVWRREDRG